MKIFFFFLTLILFININAQKQGQLLVDSLLIEIPKLKEDTNIVKVYNNLSLLYGKINNEEGLKYGFKAKMTAQKLNYKKGLAESFRNIGYNYMLTNSKKTIDYLDSSKNIYIELKDNLNLAKVYGSLGNAYRSYSNFPLALEYHFKALKLNEASNNAAGLCANYTNIGAVYGNEGQSLKAIQYYQKSLELSKKLNNTAYTSVALFGLSDNYLSIKNYDSSLIYSKMALDLSMQLGLISEQKVDLIVIGRSYEGLNKYQQSLNAFNKAINLFRKGDDSATLAGVFGYLAETYLNVSKEPIFKKNMLDSAIYFCKKAIVINENTNNILQQKNYYELLSEAEELSGNYKSAFESYKKSQSLKDSIFNSDNTQTIKNLEDKREIELRDKQIQIDKLSIDDNNKKRWLYLGGISLLSIIGGLLFLQSRNRKKANTQLQILNTKLDEANNVKTRFFGILSHDLRSPVINIINFLNLQKLAPERLSAEAALVHQQKITTGAENLLTTMEDLLLWSKGQMNNFAPQKKPIFIANIFTEFRLLYPDNDLLKISFSNPENIKLITDENYLKTILRNLTTNAIKSLQNEQNGKINFEARNENNHAVLLISDNGPGIGLEQKQTLFNDASSIGIKNGLGLHLVRDLASAIGCSIEVISNYERGTIFILKF